MDKIYSRKRWVLSPKWNFKKNKRVKNLAKVISVLIIAFSVVFYSIKGINPMFNKLASERARSIATEIVNIETSKVLQDVPYEELVKIEKDSNGNIQMIRVDVIKANMLASDMTYNIQIELNKRTEDEISIPFGSVFGNKYLAGFGPNIYIKINPVGSIDTSFISTFEEAGINQTIHRLYLNIICRVSIVTPYNIIETEIENQVLMGESVIVGNIPETYLNLEGLNNND